MVVVLLLLLLIEAMMILCVTVRRVFLLFVAEKDVSFTKTSAFLQRACALCRYTSRSGCAAKQR